MISIAVSSQKGGVGKTTLSINLAHAFARAGARTLLVDADPQGSVGLSLTQQSGLLNGFYDFLNAPGMPVGHLIVPTRMPGFAIVPSGKSGYYDTVGMGAHLPQVRNFLRDVSVLGVDVCLIDTAAGLFGATGDVISAADAIIIPQQAEPLGIRSVPKMLESLHPLRMVNPRLNILGVCLTMIQHHLPESLEAESTVRRFLPQELVFNTRIPRDDIFIRASARGLPAGGIDGGLGIQNVFDELRNEVMSKLHLAQPR